VSQTENKTFQSNTRARSHLYARKITS